MKTKSYQAKPYPNGDSMRLEVMFNERDLFRLNKEFELLSKIPNSEKAFPCLTSLKEHFDVQVAKGLTFKEY